MNRAALGLAALLTASLLAGCFHTQPTGNLVVGTEAAFPPFENYNQTSDTYEGFDIDLAREIGKRIGRSVEFRNLAFTALIPSVQQGQVDMAISAMSITDERRAQVDFSDAYYLANQSAMVKSGSSIQTVADVNKSGVKIGVQSGTVGENVAKAMGNPTVNPFPDHPSAVAALKAGQVDVVLMDRPAQVERAREDSSLRIAFDIFTDDRYGIAVKKGNVELLNQVNTALAAIQADGTMRALMTKWSV